MGGLVIFVIAPGTCQTVFLFGSQHRVLADLLQIPGKIALTRGHGTHSGGH